jgi:predicted nucleotidyltransferase
MASIRELLSRLHDHGVEFVVVGGMAAVLHGSAVVTEDLDVCAPMTPENFQRIVAALAGLDPRHRMTPQRLPLADDPAALKGFKNLYLATDAGQLDILELIDGVGDYAAVAAHTVTLEVSGVPVRVLDLDTLIVAKAAVGRPKDRRVVADLEIIRQHLKDTPPP